MDKQGMLELRIAPVREVRRDLRRNMWWIFVVLAVMLVYILISSLFMFFIEDGWTYLRAGYFTVINMTTVGFGDVVPTTRFGKVIAGLNGLAGLFFFGLFIVVTTAALQPSSWSGSMLVNRDRQHDVPISDSDNGATKVKNATYGLLEALTAVVELGAEMRQEETKAKDIERVRVYVVADSKDYSHIWIEISVTRDS